MIIEWIKALQILLKEAKSILLSEFSLWIIIAFVFSWPVWTQVIQRPDAFLFVARDYNLELSFGIVTAIFPLAFYQVFGSTPLAHIKRKNSTSRTTDLNVNKVDLTFESKFFENKAPDNLSAIDFIYSAYIQSSELTTKLYKRAGIYLVFGVIIAIGGLVFFSLQHFNVTEADKINSIIIKVLPYAGILFFIEFIAFFFLRQYRQAMHEFRYFESIKRSRESQIFIFLSAPDSFKNEKPDEFIKQLNLFDKHGILKKDEISEVLEIEKANKNDLELLSNIINVIKKKSA